MVQNIPPLRDPIAIPRYIEKEEFKLQGNVHYQAQQYEKALTAYTTVSSLDPDDAFAHYNRGKAFEGMERYGKALFAYKQAIHLDPDVAGFHIAQGQMLYILGSYKEAEHAFICAIQIDETLAEAHTGYANALRQLQQYDRALKSYQQALRLDPNNADTHNGRGIALSKLERFTEAVGAFRVAIRLKPEQAKYHYNLGRAFQQCYRYAEALDEFDRAIELNPTYVRAFYYKGHLLLHLKQEQEAQNCLAHAIKLNPDEVKSLDKYSPTMPTKGEISKKVESVSDSEIPKGLSNTSSLLEKAQKLYQKSRFGASLKIYQQIVKSDMYSADAWLGCILNLYQLHRWDKALETCNQALNYVKSRGAFYHLQGDILQAMKRYRDAIISYDNAKINGYTSETMPHKIKGASKRTKVLKNHTDAEQRLEKKQVYQKHREQPNSTTLSPSPEQLNLIPSLLERGEALLRYRYYIEAQVVFEQILLDDRHNAQAYHGLGCTLRAQGEEEKSLQAFQKAEKYRSI